MPVATPHGPLVPDFDVLINGSPVPAEVEVRVAGVTVDDSTDLPGMFTLVLSGAEDQEDEAAWMDNDDLFALGNTLEVKLGYTDDLETVIVGEITGLEPEFAFDRLPGLTVRGYDRRHRLQRGRRTRTFVQKKDSEIASQIAGEAGLDARVEDSGVTHDYVLQANQTDLDFLQERALRIQYEVVVHDRTLAFRPVGNAESEIMTLTLEDDLLEFYPRLSSMGQISEVMVRGWNPKEKAEITGQARSGDEVSKMGGTGAGPALAESAFGSAPRSFGARPVMTQAEADQLAKGRFNHAALAFISGEGVCWGRTDLRAGKVIQIDGLGRRFSGGYYVTSAVHRYTAQSGYQTHFTVRRSGS